MDVRFSCASGTVRSSLPLSSALCLETWLSVLDLRLTLRLIDPVESWLLRRVRDQLPVLLLAAPMWDILDTLLGFAEWPGPLAFCVRHSNSNKRTGHT